MGLTYEAVEAAGPLRQGEILGPVVQHRTVFPPRRIPVGSNVAVRSRLFDLVVVLSPDCDLTWDHEMRFLECWEAEETASADPDEHPRAAEEILMCRMHSYGEIRPRFRNQRDVWSRVIANQDDRYHHLAGAEVSGDEGLYLHPLFIDFKKTVSMQTHGLYDGILAGDIERVALLPAYFMHDLVHRFYGFLSRVALPDE